VGGYRFIFFGLSKVGGGGVSTGGVAGLHTWRKETKILFYCTPWSMEESVISSKAGGGVIRGQGGLGPSSHRVTELVKIGVRAGRRRPEWRKVRRRSSSRNQVE